MLESDPGRLSFLSELRRSTREFVKGKNFAMYVLDAETHPKAFPKEFLADCADLGFLGMEIPEKYGGSNLSPLEQVSILEELCRGHAGLGLSALVQNSLTSYPTNLFGTEQQKQKYLPKLATGESFACFALTEPNVGSDAKGIETKAIYDKDRKGFLIRGSKRFITNASWADIALLATRTGTKESRENGITTFLAEIKNLPAGRQEKEVSIPEPYSKVGQAGSALCEVYFDGLFVPESNVLGEVDKGWDVIEKTIQHSRVQIAAQGIGIAQRAYDEATNYAENRRQFGILLKDISSVKNHLGVLERQVSIARFLTEFAALKEEQKDPKTPLWASLAKLVAGETALWAAGDAMLLHGGMGYTKEMVVARIYNDAAVIRIYEGAAHIQVKIIRNALPEDQRSKFFRMVSKLLPPSNALLITPKNRPSLSAVEREINSWG